MGVNFRNTYSRNLVCVPSRACMMSGMYASDVNAFCNSTPLAANPQGRLVDPDAVADRAFAEQERVLNARVSRMKPAEFFEDLEGRLGTAQAKALTMNYYRGKRV